MLRGNLQLIGIINGENGNEYVWRGLCNGVNEVNYKSEDRGKVHCTSSRRAIQKLNKNTERQYQGTILMKHYKMKVNVI